MLAVALGLSACSGDTDSGGAEESYQIGITQIVEHPSLDAAREGFKQALADAGLDVSYDEQNAQGDQATATSIATTFAGDDLDLVLAIATPTAQASAQAITDVPILITAVTDPGGQHHRHLGPQPGGRTAGPARRHRTGGTVGGHRLQRR